MAADVASFTAAIDKVWRTFSTQEVALDQKEMAGLSEHRTKKYIEHKFQQQLQRARSAFLQEFRNHSVVVESEVKRIREELTKKLEDKYGEQMAELSRQTTEASSQVSKHRDEIAHLKGLVTAQESYLTAVRHRWGFEQKEQMKNEIQALKDDLLAAKAESADLAMQLLCRDELVVQLRSELSTLEAEMKRQARTFAEEKRVHSEKIRSLRTEARQQEDQFTAQLKEYSDKFAEYKAKTTDELQIQNILNKRRSEALQLMEEERQRHIQARTKPTPRIGPGDIAVGQEYELAKGARYRQDPMGMDTSWRDYKLNDVQIVQSARRHQMPKFRVEKSRQPEDAALPTMPGPPAGIVPTGPVLPPATGELRIRGVPGVPSIW
eukprot:gnl/TRDRNA2_/TRDRNA2_184088_c0_seq1.p1 gnl/TRDRNA2_/TRDRNA2_184088_c0~~gnl/TRDRNA2_/TRDRNA2_184088_c0_seq1.p1  ORF type:complete len:379 (+),score=88.30 gnl/TRDRNA2_/TRDRNA2_184088_c0_seq1:104-1240(+)